MKKPQSREEKAQYWREHINRAAQFAGPKESYCTVEGISFHSYQYWKKKLSLKSRRLLPSKKRNLPASPFIAVEVERAEPVSTAPLPDPRWVAELIIHLQRGVRP